MGDIYTTRMKFTPYPWWRRFTAAIQILLCGYWDIEGIITNVGWKKDNEEDFSTNCNSHPTGKRGQAP